MKGQVFLITALVLLVQTAFADVTDHGGYEEKFKGGGDKIPPECQLDLPRAATEPFFVKWNCTDDNALAQDIRTELWIYRPGAEAGRLIGSFLGFPASVYIDESILQTAVFTEGLPVGFKLRATDRAGISMITPLVTVQVQDNSLNSCDLSIVTDGTDSTGGTIGQPSLSVLIKEAEVSVNQSSNVDFIVASVGSALTEQCEIENICSEGEKVFFQSSVKLDSDYSAAGSLVVSPGSVVIRDLTGTGFVLENVLTELELSGKGEIDGVPATITISCKK